MAVTQMGLGFGLCLRLRAVVTVFIELRLQPSLHNRAWVATITELKTQLTLIISVGLALDEFAILAVRGNDMIDYCES